MSNLHCRSYSNLVGKIILLLKYSIPAIDYSNCADEKEEEEGKDKEEEKLYEDNDKQEDGEQEEEDEEDNWKEKVLKWLKESAKGKQEEDDSDWEGTIKFSIDDYVILQNCCKRDSISTCSTCMAITILSIPCIDNSNCDINEEGEKEGDVDQKKDEVHNC